MKSAFYRAKYTAVGNVKQPKSLQEAAELSAKIPFFARGVPFFNGTFSTGDDIGILYLPPGQIVKKFEHSHYLYVDGTFRTVPGICLQLVTIHFMSKEKVINF